ncbi:hypothetical protein WR25_17612 [Diploscapter pachys]|uniref:Uncharacterized protein n=1 Tax=Diploscapter pachys TaxID=2018661 RepID=A0A2A2K2V3_9BILA|nr:hypothetical protein WR25_17612 [Diploscapter pachys]
MRGKCVFRPNSLGQLAPVEHARGDLGTRRILVGGDPLQLVDVGRIDAGLALAAALDAHPFEQDVAQLLGAADRKGCAGEAVDHGFERGDLLAEPGRQRRQFLAIDLDPARLHPRDHRHQRAVDHLVDARRLFGGQPRLEPLPQAIGDVGVLGGVARRRFEVDLVETALRFSRADHVLVGDAAVRQMRRGELVHAVAVEPRIEVEAHDDRIVVRRHRDAGEPEHDHVELQIVPDLEDRLVLAQRLQPRERLGSVDLHRRFGEQVGRAVAQRNVARLVGAQGERHAD